MLKRFELRNYKNFDESVIIDFSQFSGYKYNEDCIKDEQISKMIIYGKNATGKTNLGNGLLDIKYNLLSSRMFGKSRGIFLNANSKMNCAQFVYTFVFDGKELVYKYTKSSESRLIEEEMSLDSLRCYYFNFESGDYDFANLHLLDASTASIERFTDTDNISLEDEIDIKTLTVMTWLINNTALSSDSTLLKLGCYVRNMNMTNIRSSILPRPTRTYDFFIKSLCDDEKRENFEEFLNLMGVECKIIVKELPDGDYQLYFKHNKIIPFFENASHGTLVLTDLYRRFYFNRKSNTIIP